MGGHHIGSYRSWALKASTQDPDRRLRHPVLRFAPSTLQRYISDWTSWHTFCLAVSADPSDPPPGTLPDWLSGGKACRCLCLLSFGWSADPSAPPSEALFLGFLLVAVWASLRWGDLLWIPPDRLHLQLTHLAILSTALRAKTTVRSMPFGFLITGVSGSPSCNWGMRFHNLLRQTLSDTQSRQPGRVIDFLPACLGGSFILEPCPRRLAVPRLLSLLHQHWRLRTNALPPQEFSLYGARSCKATVLAWSRQMSLDRALRRIQGHRRLSGADHSVELYGRDDIRPMLDLQAQVINHIRAGFRPLQPLARGTSVPLPDFPVHIPSAPLPALGLNPDEPLLPSPAFPPDPSPLPAPSPSPAPLASSSNSAAEMAGGSAPRPPSPLPLPASPSAHAAAVDRPLDEPTALLFLFNHRANVVHAVRPTVESDLLAVPDPQNDLRACSHLFEAYSPHDTCLHCSMRAQSLWL